jgi:hypothetical protein
MRRRKTRPIKIQGRKIIGIARKNQRRGENPDVLKRANRKALDDEKNVKISSQ